MPKNLFSWRYAPGFFFDADSGGGGGGGDGSNKPDPKFTQEDVDKLVGEARKSGRVSGVSNLLESLGVKTPEELSALLDEGKKAKDGQKTEIEKLNERIKQAEDKAASLEKTAAEKETAMRKRLLDSEIRIMAGKPVLDKDGKAVTRKAFLPEALDDVLVLLDRTGITEEGEKFTGIDKALESLAKAKPFLLAGDTPASKPITGTPRPDDKAKGRQSETKQEPIITSL